MRIKKFKAQSINEALKQVQEQMGENALILSTRRLQQENGMVEVLAAVDETFSPAPSPAAVEEPRPRPGQRPRHYAARTYHATPGRSMARLRSELPQPVREVDAPENGGAIEINHPVLMRLYTALRVAGVHTEMIRKLSGFLNLEVPPAHLNDVTRFAAALKRGFSRYFRTVAEKELPAPRSRVIAFVGPTGVGKTTSLAKIAARMKIDRKKRVGLISIDTYRLGAIDQLRTFAHIAELPLRVAYRREELLAALDEFSEMDIILIDTTGRNPRQPEHLAELQHFLQAVPDLQVHLVLSATTRYAEMEEIVQRYATMGFQRLLLTKIDEVMHPAMILNMYRLTTAPMTWVTNGQRIPEDILAADSAQLLELVTGGWDLSKWIS